MWLWIFICFNILCSIAPRGLLGNNRNSSESKCCLDLWKTPIKNISLCKFNVIIEQTERNFRASSVALKI